MHSNIYIFNLPDHILELVFTRYLHSDSLKLFKYTRSIFDSLRLTMPLLDNNKVDLVAYGTLFNYH